MQRLSAVTQELLEQVNAEEEAPAEAAPATAPAADSEELERLRIENDELKARIQELEAHASGQADTLWRERQREYEMLLEEKTEVIRALHQKIQEAQESVDLGDGPPPSTSVSNSRLGQAEEILRLKREMDRSEERRVGKECRL